MTTSPHWASRAAPDSGSAVEFDLLVDESAATGATVWTPSTDADPSIEGGDQRSPRPDFYGDSYQPAGSTAVPVTSGSVTSGPATSTLATEYTAATGTPGRGVILSTVLATAAAAVLDLAVVGRLSLFFDLTFVVICLVAAMGIRPRDLFTAAVLPPLAFAAAIGGVAFFWPEAIVGGSSLGKTFMTGLAGHAAGLAAGYGAALLTVAARAYARRQN